VVKFSHPPVHHVHQVLTQFRQPNQAQSSLIKPNQAISCLDAIQSQSPTGSKVATSPILLRRTPSNRSVPFVLSVLPDRSQPNPQLAAPKPGEGRSALFSVALAKGDIRNWSRTQSHPFSF
jgi:hypothetical protein